MDVKQRFEEYLTQLKETDPVITKPWEQNNYSKKSTLKVSSTIRKHKLWQPQFYGTECYNYPVSNSNDYHIDESYERMLAIEAFKQTLDTRKKPRTTKGHQKIIIYYCDVCHKCFRTNASLRQHFTCKRHIEEVRAKGRKDPADTIPVTYVVDLK